MVEICPVVDAGLLRWCSAEDLWFPRVEVGVEVDDGDGAVGAVDAAEEGEGYGVVAAEGDDPGECAAFECWTGHLSVSHGLAGEEGVVAFFYLLESVGVIVAAGRGVSAGFMLEGEEGEYDVTGMSPQSSTVAQLLKGLASRGTL